MFTNPTIQPAAAKPKKNQKLYQILTWFFIVVILFFLVKTLLSDLGTLKNYSFHFTLGWLISAFGLHLAAYIALSCSFYFMLGQMGYRIPFLDNLAYTVVSQFGSYVPGKIWVYIIRYRFLKKRGVTSLDLLAAFAIDTILLLGSAGVLTCFFGASLFSDSPWIKVGLVAILLASLIALHPKIFYPAANWFYKLLKRPPIPKEKEISYFKLLFILLINYLFWLLLGAAFFFFAKSLIVIAWSKFFTVVGVYIVAVWLGFIMLFVPNGLGVREWVKTAGLATFLAPALSVMLSLSSRLWSLANEILWSIVLFALTKQALPSRSELKQVYQDSAD